VGSAASFRLFRRPNPNTTGFDHSFCVPCCCRRSSITAAENGRL
jgi:hypothetical protein